MNVSDDKFRVLVKAIRTIREMDQGDLAEASGVNASVLSPFERGWLRLPETKIAAIEKALLITDGVRAAFEMLTMEMDKAQESFKEFAGVFDPELLAAIDEQKRD